MQTKYALLLISLIMTTPLQVSTLQAQTPDTTQSWAKTVSGRIGASQAGFQNWQGGGVNTMAVSTGLKARATRNTDRWEQTYEGRFSFGFVKQDTLDFRKAEDLIQLLAAIEYRGTGFLATFHPTFAAGLRTQFAPGFNYTEDPFDQGRTSPIKVSDFMAPATLTQSLGLTWQPAQWVTQRVGLGAKETIVTIARFRPLYGVDEDQSVRFEVGLEAFTEIEKDIAQDVHYSSKLGLFAAFNQPEKPDVLWENVVTMQVNKWLNVSFEWATLYDQDISDKAQWKEVLSVGVSFVLL